MREERGEKTEQAVRRCGRGVCQVEYNSSSVRTKITRGSHRGRAPHSECGDQKSGRQDSKESSE